MIETTEQIPEAISRKEKIKRKYFTFLSKHNLNNLSVHDTLSVFFNKIALLEQPPENKKYISLKVREDVQTTKHYWLEIILSSLIATFGLLQNSVAVIIGAMLIAPLLRPIQGVAFAMAEGQSRFFWRALKLLLLSVIISIAVPWLMAMMVPLKLETPEILARTAPNIFDLFIAIFSAIVALLAHSFKKLEESIAGVAMAASLMPPLAVVGIELALKNWPAAWGSFLLFFTNLIAILIVGVIMFLFYGFQPHQKDSKKTVQKILILIWIVVMLWIPLGSSLTRIKQKISIQQQSQQILDDTLAQKLSKATLSKLTVQSYSDETIVLNGEVRLPESVPLYSEVIDEVINALSISFERKVELNLAIIRTASLQSKENVYSLKENIETSFKQIFSASFPNGILISLQSTETNIDDTAENIWTLKSAYTLKNGEVISDEKSAEIIASLENKFPEEQLEILWVPLNRTHAQTIEQDDLELQKVANQNAYKISFELYVPQSDLAEFQTIVREKIAMFDEGFTETEIRLEYFVVGIIE
jgi:uncharacterized hydrophobic protein (TIGR00271 family)